MHLMLLVSLSIEMGFSLEYWLARNLCKSGVSDLTILYVDRGDENGIPVGDGQYQNESGLSGLPDPIKL